MAVTLEFNGIKLGIQSTGSATSDPNALDVQVGIHNTSNDRITVSMINLRAVVGLSITGPSDPAAGAGFYQNKISTLDTALDHLNTYRAKYGSTQNRLNSALNNLEVYTENMDSAQSQIRDADFAHETAEMAKFQIMAQAGTSVLAQANQINQGSLRLLG